MSTGEKWDVFYVLDQAMTELVKSVDARAVSAQQQAEDADAFTQTIAGVVTALRRRCWACSSPSSSPAASSAASRGSAVASSGSPRATWPCGCRCAAGTRSARWRSH